MKLAQLLKEVPYLETSGPRDVEVTGVVFDSRQVRPGSLFVAVPGAQHDAWEFAEEAVRRGAAAIVGERRKKAAGRVCYVQVASARAALARAAAVFHGWPARRLKLVGITGTNGKTTAAYMVRDVLCAGGQATGMIGTVAYEVGERAIPAVRTTPEAPVTQDLLGRMLQAGLTSVVMEVSSHALAQQRTLDLDFDVALFTNLTRDHLDYHQTMERYFEAKSLLFTGLGRQAKRGVAVLNLDDLWGIRLAERPDVEATKVTYGVSPRADVRAERVQVGPEGSRFAVRSPWGDGEASLGILGRYNISNALAALAAGGVLGVPTDAMIAALARARAAPGRLEQVPTGRGFQVFVDYAHTDDALDHVLSTLREITAGRLIVVFGCGGNRDRTKRPAMGKVAARLADLTVLTSDNPRKEDPRVILDEILAGFAERGQPEVIEDRAEAIACALDQAADGDVVLIAGKGHETFQEFANKTIPFDDRQVVRDLLGA